MTKAEIGSLQPNEIPSRKITGRAFKNGEQNMLRDLANLHGVPDVPRNSDVYSDIGEDGWWDMEKGLHKDLHRMNMVRISFADQALQNHNISKTEGRIAVIGCGGGIDAEGLAGKGYQHVIGIDQSTGALKVARKHAQKSNDENIRNIEYREESVYKLPFEDKSVSAIVMLDVLEHVEDLEQAFSEISRVLEDGGIVICDTLSRDEETVKAYMELEKAGIIPSGTHDPELFITIEEILDLIEGNNMSLIGEPKVLENVGGVFKLGNDPSKKEGHVLLAFKKSAPLSLAA